MPRKSSRTSSGRRNLVAIGVTAFSFAILYSSFDPLPAGEDVGRNDAGPSFATFDYDEEFVPVPPDATVAAHNPETESVPSETSEADAAVGQATGNILSNMETIKFCVLLLQDGARYMEGLKNYTAEFHKEERIDGDLKKPQTIALKVQHSPHFAVYMNWKNGERGRQVLYSEDYDDGCMIVKFGGFKRILPAVRVDPECSQAKAESRYPITQAGVLGMIQQIVKHRQNDLRRGHGVTCVRLSDQEFDNNNCYRFLLKYDDQKFSKIYRKSVLLIDAERHIPLQVTNFTWATDVDGVGEEELDKMTLIENYSFTRIDDSSELASADFSRENPRYRM